MRFILFLFLVSTVKAQIEPVLWKVERDTVKQWYYFFGDEFNGSKVNEGIWHPKYPWGGLLADEGSYADKKMVSQSEGLLKLSTDTVSEWRAFPKWVLETGGAFENDVDIKNGNQVSLRYLTSAVWSKQQFKYGYFEARCKSPSGKGLWPAFWLYGGFPNEEIDFMEMKGEKSKHFHVDVHCPNNCNRVKTGWFGRTKRWGAWIKADEKITDAFVIYSGVWKPGEIKMYLNGKEAGTFKGDFETSMHLIANLAVAQDGKAFGPGINEDTKFPSDFYVDYMRVWHPSNGFDGQRNPAKPAVNFVQPITHSEIDQSQARAKRIKRIMRDKKTKVKHIGFISMTQDDHKQLLFEKNGLFEDDPRVIMADQNFNELASIVLDKPQVYFSFKSLKKGTYNIKLVHGSNPQWVSIKL